MKLQIFISYRRDGGSEKAELIKNILTRNNIPLERIFLDTHSIHQGEFDLRIHSAIRGCTDFLIIVNKNCFKRCSNESDWLRQEIEQALKAGLNIVPVFFDGIKSIKKSDVPPSIQAICVMNGAHYSAEYSEAFYKKLLSLLNSSPLKVVSNPGKSIRAGNESVFLTTLSNYDNEICKAFFAFLEQYPKKESLTLLYFGCRDILRIHQRLLAFEKIAKVIVCDDNASKIKSWKKQFKNSKFVFEAIEFNDDVISQIRAILSKHNQSAIDIFFSNDKYRYLKDKKDFFRKLRENLNRRGGVILKAFDDDSKMCYPDKERLLEEIISRTSALPFVSDRFLGKKLFSIFNLAGFHSVRVFYKINDTSQLDMDERITLFEESFSYRKKYFDSYVQEADNKEMAKHEQMEFMVLLDKLKDLFYTNCFYYAETNFVYLAIK